MLILPQAYTEREDAEGRFSEERGRLLLTLNYFFISA